MGVRSAKLSNCGFRPELNRPGSIPEWFFEGLNRFEVNFRYNWPQNALYFLDQIFLFRWHHRVAPLATATIPSPSAPRATATKAIFVRATDGGEGENVAGERETTPGKGESVGGGAAEAEGAGETKTTITANTIAATETAATISAGYPALARHLRKGQPKRIDAAADRRSCRNQRTATESSTTRATTPSCEDDGNNGGGSRSGTVVPGGQ